MVKRVSCDSHDIFPPPPPPLSLFPLSYFFSVFAHTNRERGESNRGSVFPRTDLEAKTIENVETESYRDFIIIIYNEAGACRWIHVTGKK